MKRRTRGFTLMELMITVSLAAVILGIGVPAFRDFGMNGRLTGAANEMLVTLITARNEAVRRQTRTSFCSSATPDGTLAICDAAATQGFISFVDLNGNCQREAGEEIVSSMVSHTEIKQRDNLATCIGYEPNGFRTLIAGQPSNIRAIFCDKRGTAKVTDGTAFSYARGVEVVATGRPAVTRLFSEISLWSTDGTPVTCP
jgi:type IV fimbrial biogenesis protein FimT